MAKISGESSEEIRDAAEKKVNTESTEKAESTENAEIKLGLELSDADDYDVNADSSEAEEAAGRRRGRRRKAGKNDSSNGLYWLAFILGIVFCLAVIVICTFVFDLGMIISKEDYDYYSDLDDSYGKYYEIMKMIGEDPIAKSGPDEISDEELKEIVASSGDPYAQYFTAEEYAEFSKRYLSDYVGIGVGVMQEGDDIVIKSVFEDTPAEEAGLMEDDVIIGVDGKKPEDVDDAISMISGDAGTNVVISVLRDGNSMDFTLTREKIDTDSVGYSVLSEDDKTGYIYIASFRKDTADEFKRAVKELQSEGCEKFIIDLRDNGGGLTDESIAIADYLLPECRIMSEKTKDGTETVYNSKAGSAELDCVVLVNENTASASEILTAALQDNEACKVIGKTTYGKGVTQTTHKFKDGSAVKMTFTEYFRPSGATVQGVGITPDLEAEEDEMIEKALSALSSQ